MSVTIIPSILSADFARLLDDVTAVVEAGADTVQVDVMDGRFVPNITVGLPVVEALAREGLAALDVHLMIVEPERWVEAFVDAGAAVVTVHAEATPHLQRAVAAVRESGAKAGAALNPGSPLCLLDEVLPDLDVALLMTVNPGFGGQRLIPSVIAKVGRLRERIDALGCRAAIQVDGGVGPETVGPLVVAGATQLVAGSAVFAAGVPIPQAIDGLVSAARAALSERERAR